ncbi:MAG: metal-dependent hydrolase [Candidatus Lokiarchaeota archaeon]|nr:metal-dependent hydrolase [Candidatus Lokiarchaeota archaeon]
MPDWLTHLVIGYIIIWAVSKFPTYDVKLRKYYWIFIIGMVAPDIERIFSIIANLIGNSYIQEFFGPITTITHSFLGVLLVSLFITGFFSREQDSKNIFLVLIIGGIGHLIMDMIMWPAGWGYGIPLFYPLIGPEFVVSFGFVWPGGFIPLIIASIIFLGTISIDLITKNFTVFKYNFSKKVEII